MKFAHATAAAAALAVSGGAAQAAIAISATPGNATYAGPVATYDFETAAPVTGGMIRSGSQSGVTAQPLGAAGKYLAVGPGNGSTSALLDLSGFSAIAAISFVWGSVDAWNSLAVLSRDGQILASFAGSSVAPSPNGSWTAGSMNPLATIAIDGADRGNIGGVRFNSGINAFELDTIAIAAVPEPATWALLLLGFGALGGAMRARSRRAAEARLMLRFG